jgi:hypothetical protein
MFNPTYLRGDTIAPELFFILAVKFLFVTMKYELHDMFRNISYNQSFNR